MHLKLREDKYDYGKTKEKCQSTEKIYKCYNEVPVRHNLGHPSKPWGGGEFSPSRVQLFVTLWAAAHESFTIS